LLKENGSTKRHREQNIFYQPHFFEAFLIIIFNRGVFRDCPSSARSAAMFQ